LETRLTREELALTEPDAAPATDDPVRSTASRGTPAPRAHGDEESLVDALAVAWTAANLYTDPRTNQAFTRAVEILQNAPRRPWAVGVGPGEFRTDQGAVPSDREAAGRLASSLFAHGVATIVIAGPPTADDLRDLFRVLAAEPAGDDEGVPEALAAEGVTTIALLRHGLLEPDEDAELQEGADERDRTWRVATSVGPEAFVARLTEAGDPNRAATQFLEEYLATSELVDSDDHWGREEVVHAYVDAFFHFPTDYQARLLREFLTERDRAECLMFLDQFAGHELGAIADKAPDIHPLLLDYARIAAEQSGARHVELLEFLDGNRDLTPQQMVMNRIATVLRSERESLESTGPIGRLRNHLPGIREHRRTAANLMRGLLAVTDDDAAFQRMARMWAHQVAAAIRVEDLAEASVWAVAACDPHGAERDATLRRALTTHLDRDFVIGLTDMLTNPAPAADVIRGITPLFATDSLVERLGEEQDRSRRKGMIDALAAAAAHDPKPLLKHLDDDRWYVVRNVVVILGRSGDPRIVGRLRDSLRHPEPRVRRETLRALFALQGDASVPTLLSSLDDPDVSVRRSALFLLRSPSDPAIDEALDARLSGDGELEEKLKIIDTLAARSVPTAREVLRRRASVHVALTNTTRILRGAARTALKGET
jgi:hypothetical protein